MFFKLSSTIQQYPSVPASDKNNNNNNKNNYEILACLPNNMSE